MKLKLLALVLAVAVAVSTVSASALEHLNPMPDEEQPPALVDSGAPPTEVAPPTPPEYTEDLIFPDMLEPPAGELELEEKEPDYICTFGCTHGADEPCNFPEVEVIGAGAARVIVPKGRASVPITAIDLTSLGDGGGDATLPCIFIGKYDDLNHYKVCLNHPETGTWNGVEHINGRKDVTKHTVTSSGEDSCNPYTLPYKETCLSNCGYKKDKPKKQHTPSSELVYNINAKKHGSSCLACLYFVNLGFCSTSSGKISCITGGTCITCGAVHLPNRHSMQLKQGECQSCKKDFGLKVTLIPSINQTTGIITWKLIVESAGTSTLTTISNIYSPQSEVSATFQIESSTEKKIVCSVTIDPGSRKGNSVTIWSAIPISNLSLGGSYQAVLDMDITTDTTPPSYRSHTINPIGSEWATMKKVSATMTDNLAEILDIGIFTDANCVTPTISFGGVTKTGANTFVRSMDVSAEIKGSQTFYLGGRDQCGNLISKSITLTNIDGVPPRFIPLTENLTDTWARSKNVVLTAADYGIEKVQIGFNNESEYKLAQDNGTDFSRTYSFFGDVYTKQVRPIYLKDGLGNAQQVLIEIDKLDNTAPTITDAKQSSVPPYNTASVMITANDEHPVLGAGSGIVEYAISSTDTTPATGWQTSNRFTVPGNGTYYLWAKDAVGNVTTNKFAYTVDSMDDIPPTPPVITKSPDVPWTTSDITVEIGGSTDPDGIGVKEYQYQLNGGSWAVYNAPFTISETTEIKAKAIDMAGNESDITTAHANIDRINPLGTFSSATEWTNKPVTVTFTGTDTGGAGVRRVRPADGEWVDGDTTTQEVSVNGTYKFEVEDNAGNTALVTHTIENIDFRAPDVSKISFTKPPDSFFRSLFSLFEPKVEMYIKAVDAEADEKSGKSEVHEIEYQLVKKGQYAKPNAWKPYPVGNEDNLPEVPAQFNGVLAARSIDTAGNVSSLQSIQITLEETPPKATHTLSTTQWTCEPVIITVKGTDVDSGIRAITCPDKSTIAGDTATFSAGVNGVYDFKVIDNAGNVLDYSVTISNIDLTPPKAMHTVSKGKISISATDSESGVATITCSHGESKADKKECSVMPGQHVYQITDKAGNTFSYPVAVSGLKVTIAGDKTKNSEPDEPEPAAEPNPETGGIMCNTNIRAAAAGADADYVTTN